VRSLFFGAAICAWQLVIPSFGTIAGPFQIVALQFSADHAGEVSFELTLESAGQLTFTVL
jgi:TP901-1 family phage major tail protein